MTQRVFAPTSLRLAACALAAALLAAPAAAAATIPPPDGPTANATGPRAEVDTKRIDFGEMLDDHIARAQLQITNTGDQPLAIRGVRGSCTCVYGRYENQDIPPGASAPIDVFFNPAKRRGLNSKIFLIYTNDPRNAEIQIPVTVTVKPILWMDPQMVLFDQVPGDSPTQQRVLFTTRKQDFKITDVKLADGPPNLLSWEIGESALINQNSELHAVTPLIITLDPKGATGDFQALLVLQTNEPKLPETNLRVSGTITGDLVIDTNAVAFRRVKSGVPAKQSCTVRSRAGVPFRVTKVEAIGPDAHFVTATATPITPGDTTAYRIDATLNAKVERRDILRGEIVVHTDSGESVRVQFSAIADP